MKVVVTGLIASYPLGGVSWDYLAYIVGFARLGCQVFYLEDTGNWFYDPRAQTFTRDIGFNLRYLDEALRAAEMDRDRCWSVRSPDGTYHGASQQVVEGVCQSADLFLNVSGSCWLREGYRGARRTVYLDTDPCYSQAKLMAVEDGTASEDVTYSVGLIRAHDRFLTFAESIGDSSCRVPQCGLSWKPTRPPIVLEHWPFRFRPAARTFTTVMSWKTDVTLPSLGGGTYGGKDVEFRKFLDLPSRTSAVLEVAVAGAAPVADLRHHGWRVTDPQSRSATMTAYRDYLAQSRGEWSVAKNAYVASCSGWFSTRSTAYLALGKPVVVQDTGFSRHLPTGNGLFAFDSLDEAVASLAAVDSAYLHHCQAARSLAEEYFAAGRVLARLLADVDLT
jgi:hypothetical protein